MAQVTYDPTKLSDDERAELTEHLFGIHAEIFEGVSKAGVRKYIVDSSAEITRIAVFGDPGGEPTGYCAVHFYEKTLGGQPTTVVRSEVGVRRSKRGTGASGRFFSRQVARYRVSHPRRRMLVFACLVHPSSYAAAAKRAEEIWPNHAEETPPELEAIMMELGDLFELEQADPADPLIRHVGWVTRATEEEHEYWRTCEQPAAQYYLQRNPDYARGLGLMTLMPMSGGAMARTFARFAGQQIRAQALRVRAQLDKVTKGRIPNAEEAAATLARSDLFGGIGDDVAADLLAGARKLVYPPGQFLFRQGDRGDSMYILVEGSAYVQLGEPPEVTIVDQLSVGDVVGEVALVTGAPRNADVRTAKSMTVLQISKHVLQGVMTAHPAAAERVWRQIAWIHLDNFQRRWSAAGRAARRERFDAGAPLAADANLPGAGDLFLFDGGATLTPPAGRIVVTAPARWPASIPAEPGDDARLWWLPPAPVSRSAVT